MTARPLAAAAHPAVVLVILCSAVFMAALDMFIVNVALGAIGTDFSVTSLSHLSWVLNGYTIFYGALLVPAGRLTDTLGRKAGFQLGLVLFTVASLGCALSGTLWVLVAFRCLQAVGAAVLTPASLGLVLTALPEETRPRSIRIWASSGALAGAAGPVVGGLLVASSWRGIFLLNLPIGIATFLAAARFVPSVKQERAAHLPDFLGSVLLIVSIAALALGLIEAPGWGWGSTAAMLCWGVSAAALLAFILSSARHPSPVIELSLLRHRTFAWSNLTVLLLSVTFAAELLSVILFMEQRWHWSALQTGLAVAPGPCMVPLFAVIGQRASRRFPVGVITGVGALLMGLGAAVLLLSVGAGADYVTTVLPGWLLVGAGNGLAFPTAIASATVELPAHQSSTGSAVVNMSRQVGMVLGTSILVVILGGTDASGQGGTFLRGWWFAALVALVAAITALGISRRAPGHAPAVASPH
ncbi:MFS transporter [Pyxidicoccus parkwayensis]|uniref:MFS transporter n=1 Tax=Pyxidicoccus parkwayensis TaxID=2813578 RepID=A0ABX7NXA3_9BACT|nr:MFS transporter [Pyxidicoccus parkwaysis]QSQ23504.1 MFS transporter [Pyxidicoccus parkwaysis]